MLGSACCIQVVTDDMTQTAAAAAAALHPLDEAAGGNVVVRNGVVDPALSNLTAVPEGVFLGRLADAPYEAAAQLVGTPLLSPGAARTHPKPPLCVLLAVGTLS